MRIFPPICLLFSFVRGCSPQTVVIGFMSRTVHERVRHRRDGATAEAIGAPLTSDTRKRENRSFKKRKDGGKSLISGLTKRSHFMVTDTFCLFSDRRKRQLYEKVNKQINKMAHLYLLSFVRQVRPLQQAQGAYSAPSKRHYVYRCYQRKHWPLFRHFFLSAPNFFVTERRRRPLFFLRNARAARLRGERKGAPGHHGESVVKPLSCVIVF